MLTFSDYFSQGPNSTLRIKSGTAWSHKGQWVQVFTNTEIDKWYVGDFSSADYTITIEYNSNIKETLKILLTASPNTVNILNYGRVGTATNIATFSVLVNNSYVTLLATASSEFQGAKLIFRANYTETIGDLVPYAGPTTVIQSPLKSEYGFEVSDTLTATNLIVGENNLTVLDGVVSISNRTGSSGEINNMSIGTTVPSSGSFTTLTTQGLATINSLQVTNNITLTGNNAVINISPTGLLGTVTINPTGVGTIDNVNIGQTVAGEGTFTDLTASTSTITNLTTTNITANEVIANEVTINVAPSDGSKATRKDYVDNTAAALAIALGG
jgi:hypothetical protein